MDSNKLRKGVAITTDTFEIVFTTMCTIAGSVAGIMNIPENVPLSVFNFVAIAGMLGFVAGFGLSSWLVRIYKEVTKRIR